MHPDSVAPTPQLPDLWYRVAFSPIFGVAVPTFAGLVDPGRHSALALVGIYAAYSLVAFVIWEGNRQLHFRLSKGDDFLLRPWHRARLLFFVIIVFTIPVSVALLLGVRAITGDPGVRPFGIPTAVVAIVAIAAIITNVYETVFLLRGWESARLRSAREEAARLQAELERLTREVDPHFLFNNLHALQALIEQHDPRAATFIETLSETYRYVLSARNRMVVPLDEELRALDLHHTLAATRYGGQVRLDVQAPPELAARFAIPPMSLGELLQNALKHNIVSREHPLTLVVRLEGDEIVVSNDVRRRAQPAASTGVGLENLSERVRLMAGRPVTWTDDGARFIVRVPLVTVAEPRN